MKSKFLTLTLSLVIAMGATLIAESADAYVYYRYNHYRDGYVTYHHNGYYGNRVCRTINGHWRHGYWVSAHQECWYR